jgi:hypothetical protein
MDMDMDIDMDMAFAFTDAGILLLCCVKFTTV